jgi:seryl-tRNA synthetase
VRKSQRDRFADDAQVDKVMDLDQAWRKQRGDLDTLRMEFNALTNEIKKIRMAKEDATALMERSKELKAGIKEAEVRLVELEAACQEAMGPIGNIVHHSVPISDNEDNNVIVRTVGELRKPKEGEKLYNHVDLVQLLDIVELERGTAVAGNRGYYLTKEGVLLNQALINYGLQFACKRGYAPVHTPFFMNKPVMAQCAQLSQFDEELYKVTGEGDDKYLIATAEQTLCAMHRGEWFDKAQLPVKYIGYSTCFRKEAGSHGRDTLGIFRVHQFEKVEQFVLTSPHDDESWKMLDQMIANSEDFYQSLGLSYQVVNIVSGELNNAAAKKYDLEAWFPASATFRELVSCSNCTDYQSRRLDIRMRSPKVPGEEAKKEHVHLLNSTLSATERTLCCLLENWQEEGGVRVPPVLQPFMMGLEFIPFRKQYDAKGKLVDVPGAAKGIAFAGVENISLS